MIANSPLVEISILVVGYHKSREDKSNTVDNDSFYLQYDDIGSLHVGDLHHHVGVVSLRYDYVGDEIRTC